jgi:hypothetical protein
MTILVLSDSLAPARVLTGVKLLAATAMVLVYVLPVMLPLVYKPR